MKILRTICIVLFTFSVCYAFTQQPTQDSGSTQQRRPFGGRDFPGVAGQITEISGTTLKVKQQDGSIATVNINSSTRFRKEGEEAKLSDFKAGDSVMVRGDASGDKIWTARVVAAMPSQAQMQERMKEAMGKTMVLGDVKSIDAPKLTVQRTDGVEQAIEADENTSFRKGRGESITLPDIKVGDTIFARGELKDGSFIPASINVLDPEMARRVKEGGDMFMMGPGIGAGGEPGSRRRTQESNSSQQQSSPQQVPK
jgi:Cu/Ag efflux protein CusF